MDPITALTNPLADLNRALLSIPPTAERTAADSDAGSDSRSDSGSDAEVIETIIENPAMPAVDPHEARLGLVCVGGGGSGGLGGLGGLRGGVEWCGAVGVNFADILRPPHPRNHPIFAG